MIEIPFAVFLTHVHLQCGQVVHQCPQGTGAHRITHSDIDVADMLRYRIEHRHKKTFVRKDYRRFDSSRIKSLKNLRQLLGLSHEGWHGQNIEHRLSQSIRIQRNILPEITHVGRQEKRRSVVPVLYPFAAIVPAELRHPGAAHLGEQFPFALIKGIQPHEHIFVHIGIDLGKHVGHRFRSEPVSHLAVCHSFV